MAHATWRKGGEKGDGSGRKGGRFWEGQVCMRRAFLDAA